MSLALQIAKMKRQGCRYCESLEWVDGFGGHCKFKLTPESCGKWQIAECMLPDDVTRVFPADVWEQVRDGIDALLQLDVRVDAHCITSEQFDLLERWFICETLPKN